MSEFNRQNHPEKLHDEVFLGNSSDIPFGVGDRSISSFDSIGWKTKRKGNVAIGKNGEPLDNRWPNVFPVFVKRTEVEKAGQLEAIVPWRSR